MDTSSETVENLILDLLEWLTLRDRTYAEAIDAWRTSCPRLPIWEEATDRGFLFTEARGVDSIVRVSLTGSAFLKQRRPRAAAWSHRR